MITTERYEHDSIHPKSQVCYRSTKSGKEYIDIEIIILCPACPVDKDQEILKIEWNGEDYLANCPSCGYAAVIDVQEGA